MVSMWWIWQWYRRYHRHEKDGTRHQNANSAPAAGWGEGFFLLVMNGNNTAFHRYLYLWVWQRDRVKKKKLKKSRFFFKYKENSNLRKQLSKVYAGAMISQRDVQCCSMWQRRPINGCCGCAIDSALRSKMKNPIEPSPHAMGRHYWNSHHLIRSLHAIIVLSSATTIW